MAWPWWWQARGSGHALCVTLSGSRCLRGAHPPALQLVVRHGRRIEAEAASDFSHGTLALFSDRRERGSRRGMTAGVPSSAKQGKTTAEKGVRAGCVGRAWSGQTCV